MSTAFESIKQGLQEAIAHAKGDGRGVRVRVHRPREVDVKAVRAEDGHDPGTVRCPLRLLHGDPAALGARRPHPAPRTVRRWCCST